jgi:hypothetical protein
LHFACICPAAKPIGRGVRCFRRRFGDTPGGLRGQARRTL